MMRNAISVLALATAAAFTGAAPALAADLFRDDFNGTSLNTSTNWSIGNWQLGRTQLGFTPAVADGITRLRLDTYNPSNPGGTFRGSEIYSRQLFSRGSGIEFEARVRVNAMPDGLVTSLFTYNTTNKNGATVADEIDYEFLSKHINQSTTSISDPILATTWNDYKVDGSNFGDPNVHSSVNIPVAGLDLTQFNTVRIRWLPDRVQWYVNDVPVRTSFLAVPDLPTPIRANFWAAGAEWTDAYAASLAPTNNASLNKSYLYDIDHVAVRTLFTPVAPTAPNRVFTDRFKNSATANSDTVTGFWTTRNNNGASSVVEAGAEPLKLTAAGAGFPHAQLASAVRSEFNFFESPIAVEATGIAFTSPSGSYSKSILRLVLSSQGLAANTDSEYTAEDAFSLRIQGDNRVTLGYKLNAANTNSEFANLLVNEQLTGPVRSVKVIVHPTFYSLLVQHDLSANDSSQITSEYGGPLSLSLADWRLLTQSAPTGNAALFIQSQLNNAGANEMVTALVDSLAVTAVRPAWQGGAAGDWISTANWSDAVPNYPGANVQFTAAAVPASVRVDAAVTAGRITFDGAQPYTITGGGTIRIDTPSLATAINVTGGSHTLDVPLAIAKNLVVTIAQPSSTLAITRPMTVDAGAVLTKAGAGTLQLTGLEANAVGLLGGTTRIVCDPAAGRLAHVSALTLAPGAVLDLTDGGLLVSAPGDHALLRAALLAAYDAGRWGDTGITSSVAAADGQHATALGYADAPASFLIRYTWLGDANLDGLVDASDRAILAAGVQRAAGTAAWSDGDFNYDGTVNADDFTLFQVGANAAASGNTLLPEPASAVVVIAIALAPRRRRLV